MAWKEPKPSELDLTPDIEKILRKSIYYNREGNLSDYSIPTLIEYGVFALLAAIVSTGLLRLLYADFTYALLLTLLTFILVLFILGFLLYRWGFKSYHEAWYHFDDRDEIFSVTQQDRNGEWEIIEVPFESVESIEWVDGMFGHAIIKAAGFEFHTSPTRAKRASSVTEIWDQLARMNQPMHNWPYNLICPSCKRRYGNHTGTATCPFDNMLLLDPDVKGRIDPQSISPDDLDRV